jgi:hypothetical protein
VNENKKISSLEAEKSSVYMAYKSDTDCDQGVTKIVDLDVCEV